MQLVQTRFARLFRLSLIEAAKLVHENDKFPVRGLIAFAVSLGVFAVS